jgi:hypothetical protein
MFKKWQIYFAIDLATAEGGGLLQTKRDRYRQKSTSPKWDGQKEWDGCANIKRHGKNRLWAEK